MTSFLQLNALHTFLFKVLQITFGAQMHSNFLLFPVGTITCVRNSKGLYQTLQDKREPGLNRTLVDLTVKDDAGH